MSSSDERGGGPLHGAGESGESKRRRLRLVDAVHERAANGDFHARIVLEGPDGGRYEGSAELPANEQNYLRVACRATLAALRQFTGEVVELELIGVRRLAIQDADVIVVQLASRAGDQPHLLQGAALASDSPDLDAARAVLHATNRLIGRFLPR